MKRRDARDCLVLFDMSIEGKLEAGWAQGVLTQRVKTIKAGPMLDVECYPVWDTTTAQAARQEAKKESHRKAQAKLNKRNAKKKLKRLLDENFTERDICITLKYHNGQSPQTREQALKDVQNYIGRIKYLRGKRGLPQIRFIYVMEKTKGPWGWRYHTHLVMSGDGIEMGEAIRKWTEFVDGYTYVGGVRPGTKERTAFLEALAKYMLDDTKAERTIEKDGKNPQERAMKRMWNCSKNLRNPDNYATTADKKVSIRKAQRIADAMGDHALVEEIFAKLYPDYEILKDQEGKLEIEVKRSRWTSGVYIAAQLRRKEKHGDKNTGGPDGSERKRRAAMSVPLGGIPGGQIPGIGADVPHPQRRKARKSGSDPIQGRGGKTGRA